MGALANGSRKKGAVVKIESARRRLRSRKPQSGQTAPPSGSFRLIFAFVLAIALVTLAMGVRVGLRYALEGNYQLAMVRAFWIVLPGMLPLVIVLISRRWHAREHATPPPVVSLGKPRRKRMRR